MSGSPSRPARVLPRALLGLALAAPAGLLAMPSATAAPRADVTALADRCGVRLDLRGLPGGTSTVHLALVALDPERALALTPPGPREVDGGGPVVEDVPAEGLSGAAADEAYRATVTIDGAEQPPVELPLPECADPAVASPSPSTSPSPSGSPSASATSSATASPTSSATPSPTASPSGSPHVSATPTATISPSPSQAPVFGPRAATSPAPVAGDGGSGVVALSGAVAAAPLGSLPLAAPAPAPVVAPPTGGVAAAAAAPPPFAAPPLAAVLPSLPGQAPVAPAPMAAAPEVPAAPPALAAEPTAADGPWAGSLPAALLVSGAVAGVLGLRLRRRS